MKQEIVKVLTDGANTLTTVSGIGTSAWGALEYWDFINTNAAGIGVLLTLLFGMVAIVFNFYNSLKLNQADKNKKDISGLGEKLDTHIIETTEEFKSLSGEVKESNQGINSILNELNKLNKPG